MKFNQNTTFLIIVDVLIEFHSELVQHSTYEYI